jgi:Ser/Thr protein kinase RdoA (MazF antagonist)
MQEALGPLSAAYGFDRDAVMPFPGSEGSANLVYEYAGKDGAAILRISYRLDRSTPQIQAELDFICHLATNGVRVATPIASLRGNLIETLETSAGALNVVAFRKGAGSRVPDNGYRYRDDAPIEEYYRNWGQALGQMHAATRTFRPEGEARPNWFVAMQTELDSTEKYADRLPKVYARIRTTLTEISTLPQDRDAFGLIHADFNDGNFTVDYSNGNMTVFDFDDCCYFHFIYDLARAWESGVGRTMYAKVDKRRAFMDSYFDRIMEGYRLENSLDQVWLDRLPLFLKLVQIEEFIYFARYLDQPDHDSQPGLSYKIRCLEADLPYLGFFDPIYSPERPFEL